GEIARGRAHWRERRVATCRCVAVAESSRSGAEIRLADAADWSPEIVIILTFPNRHAGIGHGGVREGEKPGQIGGAEMHLISDVNGDLIVEARRRAQAWCSVVGPENSDKALFWCSRGRCENTVAAD